MPISGYFTISEEKTASTAGGCAQAVEPFLDFDVIGKHSGEMHAYVHRRGDP